MNRLKNIFPYFIIAFLFTMTCSFTQGYFGDQRQHPSMPQRNGQQRNVQGYGQQGKKPKFDPEKYQKDLEAFITKEAKLTTQEAQSFFPLLREMQQKQRELSRKQRELYRNALNDEKAAANAIKNGDAYDIQIKKLQQSYHTRFLKILPATKVLCCIHAEEKFNRNMMRNIAGKKPRQ